MEQQFHPSSLYVMEDKTTKAHKYALKSVAQYSFA